VEGVKLHYLGLTENHKLINYLKKLIYQIIMNREELKRLTIEFLDTFRYANKNTKSPNAILFTRPTGLGINDEILIYFHQKGEEDYLENNLRTLDNEFANLDESRRFFLSNVPLGLTPDSLKKYKFKYQVPVMFFTREFSTEKIATPLKVLEKDLTQFENERIEQPFKSNEQLFNNDLLEYIYNEIINAKSPTIKIIVAPAGYGKTVLMSSLYNKLSLNFKDCKQKQKLASQPLIMLPGHIKRASDIDGLINNFIGDEYDYNITYLETFKFWVKNGFAVWLLDGLEELILKIPEEFIMTMLDEFITAQDSKNTQIVISIRKPLLAASSELKDLLQSWKDVGITLYELSDWSDKEKVNYFNKNLYEKDRDFINQVKSSSILSEICTIPYYCKLVSDLKNANELKGFKDEIELVEYSFEKLCEREFGKGLDEEIFDIDTQKELFAELALESIDKGIICEETLIEYCGIFLPEGMTNVKKSEQIACLQRHAVLSFSGKNLEFVHDIMRQLLIGVGLDNQLKHDNLKNFDKLLLEYDSLLIKFLIKNNLNSDWNNIFNLINALDKYKDHNAYGFRNLLMIYLTLDIPNKESRLTLLLNHNNLSGLRFINLNLNGFEMQNSRLENTQFINCNLEDVKFNGCHFDETSFDDTCNLIYASVDESIFESIKVNGKSIYDHKEILQYFYKQTTKRIEKTEPCQASINLIKVWKRLASRGKGYIMHKKFILSRKCGGGMSSIFYLDSAVQHGYFTEDHKGFVKIKLIMFDEVIEFIKNKKSSPGIKKILDEVCRDTSIGCKHI
jgi:uncharacterized protein YjbI with pentapeptide repeats